VAAEAGRAGGRLAQNEKVTQPSAEAGRAGQGRAGQGAFSWLADADRHQLQRRADKHAGEMGSATPEPCTWRSQLAFDCAWMASSLVAGSIYPVGPVGEGWKGAQRKSRAMQILSVAVSLFVKVVNMGDRVGLNSTD
jgi:hypothetical protein